MLPSEIRDRLLREHRDLRQRVERVEGLSRAVLAGAAQSTEALRAEARGLIAKLDGHMRWEDTELLSALDECDEWGAERRRRVESDHGEQRELLRYAASVLDDATRAPELIARTTLDLARLLRDDMEDEEQAVGDPGVLRDDVVGIDVETG
jgi:hypothetical protein